MEDVTSNIRPMQQLALGSYKCRGLINSFKRTFHASTVSSSLSNPRKLWQTVNQLIILKHKIQHQTISKNTIIKTNLATF